MKSQIVNLLKKETIIESLKSLHSKVLLWKHNYIILITKMEDFFIYISKTVNSVHKKLKDIFSKRKVLRNHTYIYMLEIFCGVD